MRKIVLFIEPPRSQDEFPSKIGDLFMNRFAIDEQAKFEILAIIKLQYSCLDFFWGNLDRPDFRKKINIDEGLDLMSNEILQNRFRFEDILDETNQGNFFIIKR